MVAQCGRSLNWDRLRSMGAAIQGRKNTSFPALFITPKIRKCLECFAEWWYNFFNLCSLILALCLIVKAKC